MKLSSGQLVEICKRSQAASSHLCPARFWTDESSQMFYSKTGCDELSSGRADQFIIIQVQYSRYLENWYLEADLDLEASDF